ncbi:MAG: ABC transporter permease [Paracoccaceae bacterium]
MILFVLGAIFCPWLAPFDPNDMTLDMMSGLSWTHPLGTDDLGRDLLSRILHGTRVSMFIGISTVALALVIGIALGLIAGYFGGWVDLIIMRYIDLQWAFPNFIIAVYLVAVFGAGLLNVIVALSLAFVDDFARVARSMTLTLREEQYVDAARGRRGARFLCISCRVPRRSSFRRRSACSIAILGEASLSFLGLGVDAYTPTWG